MRTVEMKLKFDIDDDGYLLYQGCQCDTNGPEYIMFSSDDLQELIYEDFLKIKGEYSFNLT